MSDLKSIVLASSLMKNEAWWKAAETSALKLIANAQASTRFMQIAHSILAHNPRLGECTAHSFALALFEAARLRLEPEGVGADCYIIPSYNSTLKVDEAELQMGYLGFVKLAARFGIAMRGGMICAKDKYRIFEGSNPSLSIEPAYGKDRGNPILAWCCADLPNRKSQFVIHDRAEAERRRMRSPAVRKGKASAWDTDYNAMWLKGAFRALGKFVSHSDSAELRQAAAVDEYREAGVSIGPAEKPPFLIEAENCAQSLSDMTQEGEPGVKTKTDDAETFLPSDNSRAKWMPEPPDDKAEISLATFTECQNSRNAKGNTVWWFLDASGDKFSTFDADFARAVPLNIELTIAFERKESMGKVYRNLKAIAPK